MGGGLTLYLVAGEPSGDRLGAALMQALHQEDPSIRFLGIGGRQMTAAGLAPLFDIAELSVMGLTEVLPRLPGLIRRIRQTAEDTLSHRPDALITIDSPSFGLRVAAKVRARNPAIRTIHYVAPSVWAWRPGRAKHMARFVDHVLALLPFEPPYMEAAGMTCDFVGHPIAERPPAPETESAAFRAEIDATGRPLLLLAPGSRRGEVRRLWPAFSDVTRRMAARRPDLAIAIPVAETVADDVATLSAHLTPSPALILPETGERRKLAAFAAADAALVASGTITLEMAAAATPHVAAYRTSWLTAQIARRLLKVPSANLVNLVAGGTPVPEFLQEYFVPEKVTAALDRLLAQGDARDAQLAAYRKVLAALGRDGEPPSQRAARSVLEAIKNRHRPRQR